MPVYWTCSHPHYRKPPTCNKRVNRARATRDSKLPAHSSYAYSDVSLALKTVPPGKADCAVLVLLYGLPLFFREFGILGDNIFSQFAFQKFENGATNMEAKSGDWDFSRLTPKCVCIS